MKSEEPKLGLKNKIYTHFFHKLNLKHREEMMLNSINNKINFEFFRKLNSRQRKKFIKLCLKNKSNIDYKILLLNKQEKKIIKDNLDEVLLYYKNLFSLEDLFSDDKEALLKIWDYIDLHGERIIDNMLDPLFKNDESRNDGQAIIKMIVDDILKNEDVDYSNIKRLKAGGFSYVYSIKDKVIKLGNNGRITDTFPNNPYIVKPLLRKTFNLDKKEIFIEVCQRVDNEEYKIKLEDLYKLYAKLRDLKIKWTDVNSRNVGILLKDNEIYWKSNLEPTDESLGLETYREGQELKAGEAVILDADFLFDEDDPKICYATNSFHKEFEKRYVKERKLK